MKDHFAESAVLCMVSPIEPRLKCWLEVIPQPSENYLVLHLIYESKLDLNSLRKLFWITSR